MTARDWAFPLRPAARHRDWHTVWLHTGWRHRDPDLLSYATEKSSPGVLIKAEFGTQGAIEGVAGPEAANNATVTAALIPLLTLGIPTATPRPCCWGLPELRLNPGPQLFSSSAALVWARLRRCIGNLMLLVLNLPMVGLWVKLPLEDPAPAAVCRHPDLRHRGRLRHAPEHLRPVPCSTPSALLGVLSRGALTSYRAGGGGHMILGPLAEAQMRNAVSIGEGSWWIFLQRPMSLTLVIIVGPCSSCRACCAAGPKAHLARARQNVDDVG